MQYSLNDKVRVKLTAHGRKLYKRGYAHFGLQEPMLIEDAEGWSTWALWDLMCTFGPYINIGLGVSQCFETIIELCIDAPQSVAQTSHEYDGQQDS